MPRRKPFRIAHVSDLHLTRDDGPSRSEPRLFGRLEGMNATFRTLLGKRPIRRCDCLLVTGDVTDTGEAGAWRVFWDAIREAGLADRTLVVPGNHDVCNLGVRIRLRRRKAAVAEDLRRLRVGLRLGGQPWRFPWAKPVDPRVVVFGLDSSNPGNLTGLTNAAGEIGFPQLEALA